MSLFNVFLCTCFIKLVLFCFDISNYLIIVLIIVTLFLFYFIFTKIPLEIRCFLNRLHTDGTIFSSAGHRILQYISIQLLVDQPGKYKVHRMVMACVSVIRTIVWNGKESSSKPPGQTTTVSTLLGHRSLMLLHWGINKRLTHFMNEALSCNVLYSQK